MQMRSRVRNPLSKHPWVPLPMMKKMGLSILKTYSKNQPLQSRRDQGDNGEDDISWMLSTLM